MQGKNESDQNHKKEIDSSQSTTHVDQISSKRLKSMNILSEAMNSLIGYSLQVPSKLYIKGVKI